MTDAELAALAAALPWRDSSHARVEEMRAELLAAAPARAPRRSHVRPLALGLCAAAACVLVAFALRPDTAPAFAYHGTISPHAGATWLHASSRPDELVRLLTGTISVDVTPLGAGERFRVVTGDAEVEVKGTSFEVVADRDHLIAVRVWSGHVRVAPRGGPEVMLAPGGTWTPVITATAPTPQTAPATTPPQTATARTPTIPPQAATASTPTTVPRTASTPARTPAPVQPSVAERSYEVAWQALRAADYTAAADGFARTIELASPLSEDAAFWRGVALARAFRLHAGTSAPARDAFVAFLDRYPRSPRVGEASAMLGWLLVDAGDPAAATARFTAAKDDPVDSVRASARRGLAAIAYK